MKRILWQHTSLKILLLFSIVFFTTNTFAEYDRNKAVPVGKVLFGSVISVRNITQEELIKDKHNGWRTFGGALMGGIIGNQFGGGSGRDVATILGAIIGGNMTNNNQKQPKRRVIRLVELLIKVESGEQFMVIQDFDSQMRFHSTDKVRMIYLANDTVRIDKQY